LLDKIEILNIKFFEVVLRKKHFIMNFEEPELLQELCGQNDSNIEKLESLFESGVFCYGNEIILESKDSGKQNIFRLVIDELVSHVKEGNVPDEEGVQAVFDNVIQSPEYNQNKILNNYISVGRKEKIFPKNISQAEYIKKMNELPLVFGLGPAGTGKTFLAAAFALSMIQTKKFRKLIITRPVVESGENLGFLPGDLNQKIDPYLRPVYDVLQMLLTKEEAEKFNEKNIIEAAPLAYMRGRNLQDCCVILDEAQNTTKAQMKMFLTRLGDNVKTVITGDPSQIDLRKKSDSGLLEVMKILPNIDMIGFHYFSETDVIRSKLVKRIVNAYEKNESIHK
jgi:phosphate starvation-inducible PhoH-like protein